MAINGNKCVSQLYINNNKITSVLCVKNLYNLEYIDLSHNPLRYLPGFDKCYKLEFLLCRNTKIDSLEPLCDVKSLLGIDARECTSLKDISYLFREIKTGFFETLFNKLCFIRRMECVLPNLSILAISTEYLNEESKHIINGILNGSIILNKKISIHYK